MNQMRMRSSMPASLEEAEMIGVLNRGGMGESSDSFGQSARVIRHLHTMRYLRLGLADLVDDGFFDFDFLPLEASFAAVDVEAFAVLPGGVEQAPRHHGGNVAVLHRGRGALDGE